MDARGQGVLDESHLQRINEGLAAVHEANRQIALAKSAGIDLGNLEQDLQLHHQRLLAIKQVYFPGA